MPDKTPRRQKRRKQVMGGPIMPPPGSAGIGAARLVGEVLRPRPLVPTPGEAGRLATAAVWPERILTSVLPKPPVKAMRAPMPKPVDTSAPANPTPVPVYTPHPAAKVAYPPPKPAPKRTSAGRARGGARPT